MIRWLLVGRKGYRRGVIGGVVGIGVDVVCFEFREVYCSFFSFLLCSLVLVVVFLRWTVMSFLIVF